jgi:hypothetical protein
MLCRLFWVGILALLYQPAFSQIPGYLGNRFSLQTDLQTIQTFLGPTANNRGRNFYGEKGGGYAWNWRAGLSAGYALSRQKQLVIGVDYLKTGMKQDITTEFYDQLFDQYYIDSHSLFYNLSVKTVSLSMRKFNPIKGGIAPFGVYSGWFFEYSRITGDIIDKKTTINDGGFLRTEHGPLGINPTTNFYVLGYNVGENLIISDRFILNIGAKFRIPLNQSVWSILDGGSDSVTNQERYEYYASSRIAFHSLLTINIGGGFLF